MQGYRKFAIQIADIDYDISNNILAEETLGVLFNNTISIPAHS